MLQKICDIGKNLQICSLNNGNGLQQPLIYYRQPTFFYNSLLDLSMLTSQDIYREGAHNGVYMGLFLAVVSVLSFLSDRNSLLGIIAMPMLVCVPAIHFSLLRSAYRKYGLDASFSALWMLGITIFVGASMICALATYCYLDFADPDFFYRTATAMMEIMKGRPEMAETYKTFKVMVDGGLLPSNIEFCIQMMMLTIFSGSLLTIVLIPLVKLRFRGFNKRNFQ